MRETNRDNKEEKVMKIAVIGGAGVRTVIFINGLLKRYKKLPLIIFINGLYKKAITAINDAR